LPFRSREFRPVLGWKEDKKRRLLDELINVINARPVCLVASAVDTELFWRLTLDERRQFTGGRYDNRRRTWVEQGTPNAPYFLAFHHCIKVAGGLVPEGETLLPVFAEHPDYKIKAHELYPAIRNDPRLPYSGRLAEELIISSPRTVAMLQAADLAAYGFYQFSSLNDTTASGEWYFQRLVEELCHTRDTGLFNKRGFQLMLDDMSRRPQIAHLRRTHI
jgi:hypothetical protein